MPEMLLTIHIPQTEGNWTAHASTLNVNIYHPPAHNVANQQPAVQQYLVVPPGYSVTISPASSNYAFLQPAAAPPSPPGARISPVFAGPDEIPPKVSAFRR